MNYSENVYRLEEVSLKNNMISFKISLNAPVEIRELYFKNYFDGLYFGQNEEKYLVSTEIEGDYIVGSIMYDTYDNYKEIPCRLWVRNRIGDMYLDQAVLVCAEETEFTFGHKNKGMFTPLNAMEFTFNNVSVKAELNNPFDKKDDGEKKETKPWEVLVDSITTNTKAVTITGVFSEGLIGKKGDGKVVNYCLMWRDNKSKQKYYFHTDKATADGFKYELTVSEMDELGKNDYNDANFSWFIVCGDKKEHSIFLTDEIINEPVELPARDINAVICKKDDSTINMRVNTIMMFTYEENSEDGRSIILGLKKKSYDNRVKRFIVQRVNTNIEVELPFTIYKETETNIYYQVCLTWENIDTEFKPGVRQLFIEIENGIDVERHNLKLKRTTQVKENYYLVAPHPFALVNGYAHSCLLYLDSSNNLKCNLRTNVLKVRLDKITVENTNLKMGITWKDEPYFENLEKVTLITETGDEIDEKVKTDGSNAEVDIELNEFFDRNENMILKPELCFDGDVRVKLENNYNRPVVSNRETMSFSRIAKIAPNNYKRVWGNLVGKAYAIGITENVNLLKTLGLWLYEDTRLCIKLDWLDEDIKAYCSGANFKVLLRDKVSEETIQMVREQNVSDEYIFYVELENLKKKNYLVCVVLDNGMVSYVEMSDGGFALKSSTTEKKINIAKNDNMISLVVEDLLLFEDDERRDKAFDIVAKAKAEADLQSKKIWLIGENLGLSARDNGLAFFEYCMKHKDEVDADFYFVTKKENEDIEALDAYKDNVVYYDSAKHLYLDELAEFYIVSHGVRDVMPSLYHDKTGKFRKPIIYLQHGISGMKIYDISNKSYGGSIRKFVVSSENEKELLVDNSQFWDDEMISTGLARYDKLNVTNTNDGKYIWVMPTWRDWLIKSERDFIKSDFYLYYSQVLSDKHLIEALRKAGQKLVFSLHIEFEKYKPLFDKFENDVIHITDMHEAKIADRVKECSMIATDYSSIIFDVVYLKKPAAFFQFDYETYNKYRGSYVDMKTELPGVVTYTPDSFIAELIRNIDTKFELTDIHKTNSKRYFDYCDTDNSKRIYESIIECREEMADEY